MVSPNGHIWGTEECPPALGQARSSGAAALGQAAGAPRTTPGGLKQIFASIIMAVQGDDLWLLLDVCNPFGDKNVILVLLIWEKYKRRLIVFVV